MLNYLNYDENRMMQLVRHWQQSFGIPRDQKVFDCTATIATAEQADAYKAYRNLIELRMRMQYEETGVELTQALSKGDIVEIADAIVDSIWLLMGTADIFGIPLSECFEEVYRSNMSKLPEDGIPLRRQDGKVLKPPGYTPPDLVPILQYFGLLPCQQPSEISENSIATAENSLSSSKQEESQERK